MKGCDCGGKFFFFVKKKDVASSLKVVQNLTKTEKVQMEEDVGSLVGEDLTEKPVILDFESVRVKKPGKYELDLIDLFKKKPLVYQLEDGKYVIDLASSFETDE
tara:strand:+ start:2562 stop:2873 length:312 start_codon:yes stop_codon:yes gene_type:complete